MCNMNLLFSRSTEATAVEKPMLCDNDTRVIITNTAMRSERERTHTHIGNGKKYENVTGFRKVSPVLI